MVVTTEEAVYINSDEGPIKASVAGAQGAERIQKERIMAEDFQW